MLAQHTFLPINGCCASSKLYRVIFVAYWCCLLICRTSDPVDLLLPQIGSVILGRTKQYQDRALVTCLNCSFQMTNSCLRVKLQVDVSLATLSVFFST